MIEVKSPYITGGAILLGIAAVLAGLARRDAVDLGATAPSLLGLVASAEKDQNVSESAYYEQLSQLLKSEYVDPITDDAKLADGAVRGMVLSLQDPKALYFNAEEMEAFERAQSGEFEGIGVSLAMELPKVVSLGPRDVAMKVPKVVVSEVVPDGPAGRAGVQVGDVVYMVDGHWVVSSEDIAAFRKIQEQVDKKKLPPDALMKARADLRKKTEKSILPTKAFDELFLGKSGSVKVTWKRGGVSRDTALDKAPSKLTAFRFDQDAASDLKSRLSEGSKLELDLRNNATGDVEAAFEALSLVSSGRKVVGQIVNQRGKKEPVEINGKQQLDLTVTVDSTTKGAAAIFAQTLASIKPSAVKGVPSKDMIVVKLVRLPNGTGYTLPTGEFRLGGSK